MHILMSLRPRALCVWCGVCMCVRARSAAGRIFMSDQAFYSPDPLKVGWRVLPARFKCLKAITGGSFTVALPRLFISLLYGLLCLYRLLYLRGQLQERS